MGVPFLHRFKSAAVRSPAGKPDLTATFHAWPLSLVGAHGPQFLNFSIIGLGETAPRGAGIFVYARRATDGQWQALYIGETADMRNRLSFNEIAADALMSGATDIHVLMTGNDIETRRRTCEQMIRINRPLLNEASGAAAGQDTPSRTSAA